jgi:outer membrane protein TolC
MRFISLALILLFAMPAASGAVEPIAAENLQELVATALANNPELKSAESRWRMFTSRVAQAGSLEDPMLMLKIQNGIITDPLNFGKDPMTQKVIGISQQFPFWGKRGIRTEVAEREAEAYQWQIEERRLELARMVKESYAQLFFTDRALAIVDRNIRILDDFITLTETRYSVGQGVQQDIFKAQVERSKMLEMQINLAQQRRSKEAALNTLLARPADTPVGPIPEISPAPVKESASQLQEEAEANRPIFKQTRALIQKGEAGHRLAELESYPDFTLSLELMQRSPTMNDEGLNMYSLGVTFNLPVVRTRREAMLAESASETSMASSELNALRNTINGGIADLLAQLERRRKLIELYRFGIIPQAEQALESATIAYRVGKVDFLTLLESRTTLFSYEREYYDSLADHQMKRAQLEALVGKELL